MSPAVELILWMQNRLYSYRRMSERLLESLCITTGTLYREVSAAVRVLIRGVFFIRQSFVERLHCTPPIIIATHCLLTLPLENGCMDDLNQSIGNNFLSFSIRNNSDTEINYCFEHSSIFIRFSTISISIKTNGNRYSLVESCEYIQFVLLLLFYSYVRGLQKFFSGIVSYLTHFTMQQKWRRI